jgi:hypothetical protein
MLRSDGYLLCYRNSSRISLLRTHRSKIHVCCVVTLPCLLLTVQYGKFKVIVTRKLNPPAFNDGFMHACTAVDVHGCVFVRYLKNVEQHSLSYLDGAGAMSCFGHSSLICRV